jgi:hypothetical protein
MSIKSVINSIIAFCVFFIIWVFLAICVLPHITGMIGLPSLQPYELWRGIYKVLERVGLIAFSSIMLIFIILYVVYKIINALPDILLSMIGWVWPPFPQLIAAGIFPLFDSILGAIFSTDTVERRFNIVANGVKNMFTEGLVFLINDLRELGFPPNGNALTPPKPHPIPDREPSKNPPAITSQVQAAIDQKYNQCLQENLINITADMTSGKLQYANVANQVTRVKCKMNQFTNAMQLLAERAI